MLSVCGLTFCWLFVAVKDSNAGMIARIGPGFGWQRPHAHTDLDMLSKAHIRGDGETALINAWFEAKTLCSYRDFFLLAEDTLDWEQP